MSSAADVLVDGLDRVREGVHAVLEDLPPEHLVVRPAPGANPIAWLLWHLTRVQDDHLAEAAGTTQAWHEGWADRFGLPLPPEATGYGAHDEEVTAVRASAELLRGYHDAVHARSVAWVRELSEADLERVVDEEWDPPVTLGVRLVSVLQDDLMHVGQATYARGLLGA